MDIVLYLTDDGSRYIFLIQALLGKRIQASHDLEQYRKYGFSGGMVKKTGGWR
jgi:hypothetical protein